jgi:aspartate aminotransferase-like enzyme
MATIVKGIQKVLYTESHIYLASHAATGLWEMGIRNSVRKRILHTVNGSFSSKWATVSRECGCGVDVIDYEWGRGVKYEDIDKFLSSGKYDVFAMVHNETSTGVMSPLEPIADLMKSKYPDVIWLVDAVSSMAGHKIEVDNLGIDFILSSTQKAWGLPAGFSICPFNHSVGYSANRKSCRETPCLLCR